MTEFARSGRVDRSKPFNISSFALLTHMVAQVCELSAGEFIHVLGDAHIYLNHLEQARMQIERTPLPAPNLWLNPEITDIDSFTIDDIALMNYQSHPAIKLPIAV